MTVNCLDQSPTLTITSLYYHGRRWFKGNNDKSTTTGGVLYIRLSGNQCMTYDHSVNLVNHVVRVHCTTVRATQCTVHVQCTCTFVLHNRPLNMIWPLHDQMTVDNLTWHQIGSKITQSSANLKSQAPFCLCSCHTRACGDCILLNPVITWKNSSYSTKNTVVILTDYASLNKFVLLNSMCLPMFFEANWKITNYAIIYKNEFSKSVWFNI